MCRQPLFESVELGMYASKEWEIEAIVSDMEWIPDAVDGASHLQRTLTSADMTAVQQHHALATALRVCRHPV